MNKILFTNLWKFKTFQKYKTKKPKKLLKFGEIYKKLVKLKKYKL